MKYSVGLALLLPLVAWSDENASQIAQNTSDIAALNAEVDTIQIEQAVQNTRLDNLEAAGSGTPGPVSLPASCITGSAQGEIHVTGGWISQNHVINSGSNFNHVHISDVEIFNISSFNSVQVRPFNSTVFISISPAFPSRAEASVCMHDLMQLLNDTATIL